MLCKSEHLEQRRAIEQSRPKIIKNMVVSNVVQGFLSSWTICKWRNFYRSWFVMMSGAKFINILNCEKLTII